MFEIREREELSLDAHWEHRRKLAVFCRIVAEWGYIGALGHISIRVPGTDVILVTPGAGSEKTTVRADQVFAYDINGKLLHHPGGELVISEPAEYFIHTRIHRDRPELQCVAHIHSPTPRCLESATDRSFPSTIRPSISMQGFPLGTIPSSSSPMSRPNRFRRHWETRSRARWRGHGSVVVGETPEIGLMNVYTVEENVKYQIAGEPLGGPVLFPKEVIEESAKQRGSMAVEISKLLWAYFERKVLMAGLPL